jgi:tetratricopeptide (TPR) repeat protein
VTRRLLALLGAGFVLRAAYVLAQPRFDPTYGLPILDGAYYVDAARSLTTGAAAAGVYYMPPLYPWALAVFLRVAGLTWIPLFLLQQLAVVVSAGLLARVARSAAGEVAGLAAAAVVLLYHPLLFFASCPVGESVALLLLAASLALVIAPGMSSGFAAGIAAGLGALARPNLLPLTALWAAWDLARGRAARAGLVVAGTVLAIAPAAWHNYRASGHVVPVSANGGVVFWLGNAPGAVGVYTPAPGFSGALATQQQEAISEACARTGRPIDAVAADGFWWREGMRARLAEPLGSIALLARRAALTVDSAEHGLDYAPALDANPLRWAAPLPFALLLALAVLGAAAGGGSRTGGFHVWSAVAVAAAAPLLFYVSSRHRLPLAFLLAVPAGAGVAALSATKRAVPYACGLTALAVSLAVPSGDLLRTEHAGALTVLASVEQKAGKLGTAAETARRATEIDPENAAAWYNRGFIAAASGHDGEAESFYRRALVVDPAQPDAAANLAVLLVRSGRAAEAPPILERAVAGWPRHLAAWTNLVVAYAASGDHGQARETVRRAREAGVALDPALLRTVEDGEGR